MSSSTLWQTTKLDSSSDPSAGFRSIPGRVANAGDCVSFTATVYISLGCDIGKIKQIKANSEPGMVLC